MGIDDVKFNLDFLEQNYGNGKLEDFVYGFGYKHGLFLLKRRFSVINPAFRNSVKQIKEDLGYEGNLYTFSDSPSVENLVDEFNIFLADVEKVLHKF